MMQQLGLSPGSTPKRESRLLRFLWPDLGVLPAIGSAIDMGKNRLLRGGDSFSIVGVLARNPESDVR